MTSPNPVQIIKDVVTAMNASRATADKLAFYYGRKPDQNFGEDDQGNELTGDCCFSDPISMIAKSNLTNVDEWDVKIFMVFGSMLRDPNQQQKIDAQNRAIANAREFYYRLNQTDRDKLKDVGQRTIDVIESLFDIELSGCSLATSFIMIDASSNCYP